MALAVVAVFNARRHAALTGRNSTPPSRGRLNVERVNGLIYAAEMDSRGIYMAPDAAGRQGLCGDLRRLNDRIGDVVTEWQWTVRPEDAAEFERSPPASSSSRNSAAS